MRRNAYISNKKYVWSGGMLEFFQSVDEDINPYAIGLDKKPRGSAGDIIPMTEEEKAEKDRKNMLESFHAFVRKAGVNFRAKNSIFVTLTFADTDEFDVTSVDDCNAYFERAMKRLRRKLGKEFKYQVTIEFQDKYGRGAVHYHMLINLPFVQQSLLKEAWGKKHGVYVKQVKNTEHAINYLAKYMRKGETDERLRGRKKYWGSKNLKKPIEGYGPVVKALEEFIDKLPEDKKKKYSENTYFSEYHHTEITYKKFFLPEELIEDFLSTYNNYTMKAV